MQLSIGMIVKNEEKYLRMCLEGLKQVLDAIPSELIIADTGSTDKTVEIAKEFTDKIFHFDWCNDFAAARNVTVEHATGEWYMFIDADEIIEDASELIDFFKSGEYRNYTSGSFVIRNYGNLDKTVFSDFRAPRLTTLIPETKFIGLVHESLSSFGFPIKYLDMRVSHFGYIVDDKTSKKKAERNIPLILKEIEDRPDQTMLYLQAAESYVSFDEEKALEYIDKGIEVGKRMDHYSLYGIWLRKAEIYMRRKEWNTAAEIVDEYFNFKSHQVGMDLEMYAHKAMSLFYAERYAEAIPTFKQYAEFYREYNSGKHHTPDIMLCPMGYSTEESHRDVIFNAVVACIKEKKFNTAKLFFKYVPYQKWVDNADYMQGFLKQVFLVMRNLGDFSGISKICSEMTTEISLATFFAVMTTHISGTEAKEVSEKLLKQKLPADVIYTLKVYHNVLTDNDTEAEKIEAARKFKDMIKIHPEMKPLIQLVTDKVKEASSKKESEFDTLAKSVKHNIRMFIRSGKYDEALNILEQLEKLCPDDNEIPELKKMCGR